MMMINREREKGFLLRADFHPAALCCKGQSEFPTRSPTGETFRTLSLSVWVIQTLTIDTCEIYYQTQSNAFFIHSNSRFLQSVILDIGGQITVCCRSWSMH